MGKWKNPLLDRLTAAEALCEYINTPNPTLPMMQALYTHWSRTKERHMDVKTVRRKQAERREAIREMYAREKSQKRVARFFGVSETRIHQIVHKEETREYHRPGPRGIVSNPDHTHQQAAAGAPSFALSTNQRRNGSGSGG